MESFYNIGDEEKDDLAEDIWEDYRKNITDYQDYSIAPKQSSIYQQQQQQQQAEAATNTSEPYVADMVMVYKSKDFDERLQTFLENLRLAGLQVRQEAGTLFPKYHAAVISASDKVLEHYSNVYGFELSMDNPNWIWMPQNAPCRSLNTELTQPTYEDSELVKRAEESVERLRPDTFTHIERVMIVNKIMENNQYTDKRGHYQYGYDSLKQIAEVYPLHESPWKWSRSGKLEDRQLLYHFWASHRNLFKVQPMFMIEKYFSTEGAFFFLLMGFHNRMLMFLAVAGVIALISGYFEILFFPELQEFCDLDLPVCPICQDFRMCPIDSLKLYCKSKAFSLFFDNISTVVFSMFASVWSLVYIILWRRKQATMALRWNVRRIQYDESLRPEFRKYATVMKISRFTQKQTVDIPFVLKVRGYAISYVSIIILLACSIFLIFAAAFYKYIVHALKITIPELTEISISISAAVIYGAIVLYILIPFIESLPRKLTVLECHRTQQSFNCSLIYKEFLLCVPSFYGIMIYLSLFKGKFFTYPTDATRWTAAGAIPADTCNPAGCMIDVTIQFIVMMTLDTIKIFFRSISMMYIKYFCKIHKIKYTMGYKTYSHSSRWEKDFLKVPTSTNAYLQHYNSLMLSYGLITWFASICPLGAVIALIKHIMELRLIAYEFLIVKRRVIGVKVPDISCWNNIMIILTISGIVANGAMITFSGTSVHRFIYAYLNNWTLKGYARKSFSNFDTKKFSKIAGVVLPKDKAIAEECYYRGYKVDFTNKESFLETNYYWLHLFAQVTFMLTYENVVLIAAGIIFLFIRTIPQDVRLKYKDEEDEIREARIEILNDRFIKQNRQYKNKK